MMVDRCPEVNKIFILLTFISLPFFIVSTSPDGIGVYIPLASGLLLFRGSCDSVPVIRCVTNAVRQVQCGVLRWMPVQLLVTQRVGMVLIRCITSRRAVL